jgi:dethiobiotin synthetase
MLTPLLRQGRGLFVKTYFCCRLAEGLRSKNASVVAFKPLCCGDRDDAVELAKATGQGDINVVNPFWYRTPAAPYAASMIENRPPDLHLLRETFSDLEQQAGNIIVEGAGGWLVPITESYSMADLAVEFGLPVVIVVPNRLGCINHTLLTIASVQSYGLSVAGLVMNHITPFSGNPAEMTNAEVIAQICKIPILCNLDFGTGGITIGDHWRQWLSIPD